jgi:uncharacterized protein with ParB-like and HNH nuclease domain
MYKEGELEKPELQRYYVWDKSEASRFIESLLLGLPVPSIFLAKSEGEKKLIIDGYQRIMTVYEYVEKGVFSKDNKVFKLSNSEKINVRWRGKAFSELSEIEQRKIRCTTIHAIIFEQKEPKNDSSMYQVFERINTSGRTLLPQEIRNCIYQGNFNKMLFEINSSKIWREMYGLPERDTRMRDMEYILRFFALQQEEFKNQVRGQISMKKFLNDFMKAEKNIPDRKYEQFKHIFESTMNFLKEKIGGNSFCNLSAKDDVFTNKFHPTIFDAFSIATAYMLAKVGKVQVSDFNGRRIALLRDAKFKTYISVRTTNIEHIKGRIQLASHYLFDMKYE